MVIRTKKEEKKRHWRGEQQIVLVLLNCCDL